MAIEDRRKLKRVDFKNHPVSLYNADGTKIQGYTSNISLYGFMVLTNRLSARTLTPLTGMINQAEELIINLSMTVPHKNGILKIGAQCNIVYIGVDSNESKRRNHAIGIHITSYNKGSQDAVNKIINNEVEIIPVKSK